jgi:alanyl-tRNA synthetase
MRYGRQLNINNDDWLSSLAQVVIADYAGVYPELARNQEFIKESFSQEEKKFKRTLEKGLIEFNKIKTQEISGAEAFNLYQSYGFPLEITEELARERGLTVDRIGFEQEFVKHQELSRTASAGKFKGGLADSSVATTRLHTAAHLLLEALRRVLGAEVFQKGSNITAERLRFDFSYDKKMSPEELAEVEKIVNQVIGQELPVAYSEMSLSEAREAGAMGVFDSKYDDRVRVYEVTGFSKEICGGPHVSNTKELGHFRIIKEESSSAGVRRIKAILE